MRTASMNLRQGDTNSCGCLRNETIAALNFTHGESSGNATPEYVAYQHAKQRCTNQKNKDYKDYGGRGIKFLFTSYEQFLADVGRKPAPELLLDRIDNESNYQPGNMRWADRHTQVMNRRHTKRQLAASRRSIAYARKFIKGSQRPIP
jgi:hypothetical protein